jgi:hypothetical protein
VRPKLAIRQILRIAAAFAAFWLVFSIFKTCEDGSLNRVESAETLESAKQRAEELAEFWPGKYVIVNQETGAKLPH